MIIDIPTVRLYRAKKYRLGRGVRRVTINKFKSYIYKKGRKRRGSFRASRWFGVIAKMTTRKKLDVLTKFKLIRKSKRIRPYIKPHDTSLKKGAFVKISKRGELYSPNGWGTGDFLQILNNVYT